MILSKKATLSISALTILTFTGCGSSGGGSGSTETSKFDTAKQINLSEIVNYDIIVGGGNGATNLRSINSENNSNSTTDKTTLRLSNILKEKVKYSIQNAGEEQSSNLRAININGNTLTSQTIENGNISGTVLIDIEMNVSTGKITGTMKYSNYKNSQSNSCGGNKVDNLNGTTNITATFDTSTYDLKTMSINLNSDFFIDDMIWESGTSMNVIYNSSNTFDEDSIMTMTVIANVGTESIGFKNYKIRSYSYNGYEYTYPIEGDIYIFTDDINGYFSIDTTYDHSLTPTQEDFCGEYTYSGKEKYIGKDSSLIWEVTSTNNYKIEIDSNNDGIFDINHTATF